MIRETMTSRERWLAVLRRETTDRIPMDYWGTGEATQKLLQHLGVATCDEVVNRLHLDTPVFVGPAYVGPTPAENTDMFGCKMQVVDYGTGVYGECVHNPLAQFGSVAEIERNYTWPTADWFDFSIIKEQVKGQEKRAIRGGGSEPMLLYKMLRGQELAFMDLLVNPEIVHYCLGKLFDLAYETTRRVYEQIPGQVMITYVAEDMGGQASLMYSPAQIREFLLPGMKRIADLAHEAGAYVFHHNDGAVREIIPEMIETVGIDVLNPIQWRCPGMEREGLKRDFGDRIVFHGAVDNQFTLPFGTVADVRREVEENIRLLGAGGGYILAPCHNVQAVSPAENIVAMYEAGLEFGWS